MDLDSFDPDVRHLQKLINDHGDNSTQHDDGELKEALQTAEHSQKEKTAMSDHTANKQLAALGLFEAMEQELTLAKANLAMKLGEKHEIDYLTRWLIITGTGQKQLQSITNLSDGEQVVQGKERELATTIEAAKRIMKTTCSTYANNQDKDYLVEP